MYTHTWEPQYAAAPNILNAKDAHQCLIFPISECYSRVMTLFFLRNQALFKLDAETGNAYTSSYNEKTISTHPVC